MFRLADKTDYYSPGTDGGGGCVAMGRVVPTNSKIMQKHFEYSAFRNFFPKFC